MEADVRTCLSCSLYETNPELFDRDEPRMRLPIWFGPKTEEESIWNIIRSFAKVICSGQSLWWFDMWGGWYQTDKIMDTLAKMREEYARQMQTPFRSKSEVAVVLDEMSSYALKNSYFTKVHYQQLVTMGNTGAPYDLLLKSCVNIENLQKYKCIIYIAPYSIENDAELLQELSQQGKIVVLTGKKYNICGENIHNIADSLTETELREYLKKANVHIYSEKSALIYAMEGYISITACEDGEYVLQLDKECLLENLFGQEKYFSTEQKVVLQLRKNQTLFFKIKDRA